MVRVELVLVGGVLMGAALIVLTAATLQEADGLGEADETTGRSQMQIPDSDCPSNQTAITVEDSTECVDIMPDEGERCTVSADCDGYCTPVNETHGVCSRIADPRGRCYDMINSSGAVQTFCP